MDEENEILASFTFGKENLNITEQKENMKQTYNNILNNKNSKLNSLINNNKTKKKNIDTEIIGNKNYFEIYSAQNYNIIKDELNELTFGANKNNLITNPNELNNENNSDNINLNNIDNNKTKYSLLINQEGTNDSFIFAVIYSIYHIKLFKQYLLNDLNNKIKNSKKVSLLYILREILNQMDKNEYINISNFRFILSDLFQNHRKFLIDQPDDPSDLLFALINSIHSFNINIPLNEISDENCIEKCFSHKFIWLDLSRIDKCKCNGSSKRLFSNHNYITDIPMNKIFNLIDIKKNIPLYENNQKLFEYYTNLISKIKSNCPINGQRCPINKTTHKLHLSNSPAYLIFNLEQNFKENNSNLAFNSLDILKNFVLIPNQFDIWDLFELNSRKNKNNFDLLGFILFKISKVYSCAFKNKKGLLVYYDCNWEQNNINNNINCNNNIIEFVSYFDFVYFCIKKGLIPLMIFYQGSFLTTKDRDINNNINNYEGCLNKEQINMLEKFCINNDNLYSILNNTLRKKENLMISKKSKNNIDNMKIKNDLLKNKYNIIINEYICPNCNYKNKIANTVCIECNNNNKEFLSKKIILNKNNKNIPAKNESQSLNHSQAINNKFKFFSLLNKKFQKSSDNLKIKKEINKNKIKSQLNKRKKICKSPDIIHRETHNFLEKYNFETFPEKNDKYILKLPISFLKVKKNSHNKIQNQKYFLNKTEMNNDNNNIFKLNKNDIIKNFNKSPKLLKNKIIKYNYNQLNKNIISHKKVLSSNEKFDFLKLDDENKNIKSKNINKKIYKTSRTISNIEKIDKNKINEFMMHVRKNLDLKNDLNKINYKIDKNIPITTMHYSHNNINY